MEWLNYHHLFYFWVVCKEGGFAKAATQLRIAQSAISIQIAKLEAHFGEKLMERSPRGFTLTEAGQVALAQSEEIFRQGHELLQYFRSGKMKSHFKVGALGGLSKNLQIRILDPVLSDPEIELSIEVGDLSALIDHLQSYQLDAVLSDVTLPNTLAAPLVQTEVASEVICLVGRKKPTRKQGSYRNKIASHGVYLPAQGSPITSALADALSNEIDHPQIRGYISDIAFLRLLALETDALIAIPKIGVQRDLDSKDLHIFHEFKKIRQNYYLVYRQKGKRHPILNLLLSSQ